MLASNQPQRAHAGAARCADDHMVVDGDLHVTGGFDQILGDAHVLARRSRVAAWMIVDNNQSGGSKRDREASSTEPFHIASLAISMFFALRNSTRTCSVREWAIAAWR